MATKTDADWQAWGSNDPYHAALSFDRFKQSNWTEESSREFFQTGEDHIERVFKNIASRIDAQFNPTLAIDFGCGPGRLVLPLARRCRTIIGVDVSESMLAETRRSAERRGLENVVGVLSDETLSQVPSDVDLVHSFIVFQHIPTQRGLSSMAALLGKLRLGGIAALHVTIHRNAPLPARVANQVRYNSKLVAGIFNLMQRKAFSTPLMRRFMYPPVDVLNVYRTAGIGSIAIDLEDQGNCTTATFYGQRIG